MQPTQRIIYEFGPFRLDFQRHALSKTGQPVSLPPKAFDILVMLLERRDTLVSKTDLLSQIWPNAFVEENNLAQHVSLLRKTLGENPDKPQYIETVPRVGYRFIADVRLIHNGHENGSAIQPAAIQPASRSRWKPRPVLLLAALPLVALLVFLFWPTPAPAVLDYVQLTHDGYPKHGPLMTDREFVYFTEIRAGVKPLVRVPATGGDPVVMTGMPADMQPVDLSRIRHEVLALQLGPTGAELPLWAGVVPAGSFRRVGSIRADSAAWSAGSDRIFYARGRALYVAKSDGSESKEVVTTPGRVPWLQTSPDGRLLTFQVQREKGTTNELWEARQDGTHLRRVSSGVSSELQLPAGTWTHDSRYFLFSETGESKLWLGGLRRPLHGLGVETRTRLNTGLLNVIDIVAAADQDRILAISALDRMEIFRYDTKSGGLAPYLRGVSADGLAFSRQGDWVAYTTYPDRRLVRSRTDGSDRRQLIGEPQTALLPSWSPDGKRIAYMGRTGSGPWKIHTISKDGAAPEEVVPGAQDQANPTWSPDGASLIYAGAPWVQGFAPNSTPIQQVDLRTHITAALPESAGLWSPRWSPDGKYLVAETNDSQRLMLFDFSTKAWTPLASLQGERIGYTSWSHDSRYVYYNGYVYERGSIYRVDVLHRTTERIWAPDEPGMAVTLGQWFTLAPDDSPILLRNTSVHELFAIDLRLP